MIINRKICPAGLPNNPNRLLKSIDYITIHNTGNYKPTATAKNHADYLYSGTEKISWHYTVDKSEIWQSFEDKQECWHAGNPTGNSTSIAIEICVNDKLGFEQACDNAAWLTAELLKKHELTTDKVVQHFKWSGKNCPEEIRRGTWGVTWDSFIAKVREYLGLKTTTIETNTSIKYYKVQVGAYAVKSNAEATLAKLKTAGFTDAVIKYE